MGSTVASVPSRELGGEQPAHQRRVDVELVVVHLGSGHSDNGSAELL
jgi:hypothetical protein